MTVRNLNGWHLDRPDRRDALYAQPGRFMALLLPSKVDDTVSYADLWPTIFDQGNLGSCVFNAWARALGFMEAREGNGVAYFSRLFPYWHYRRDHDCVNEDSGATIRDGIKTVAKYGIPVESLWPYNLVRWRDMPGLAAEVDAGKRVPGLKYLRITNQRGIKDSLAKGFPVVFGTVLYDSFMNVSASSPVVPMPGKDEEPIGGHAMCMVGYDDKLKLFKVANSWGPDWGEHGYCYIPYDYITACADDFWTIRHIAK